ncbi:hypothetical protein NB689_000813 [Xanthomonas sacchari]|nr:hypothetical protein [Xanthomonas sacchari]
MRSPSRAVNWIGVIVAIFAASIQGRLFIRKRALPVARSYRYSSPGFWSLRTLTTMVSPLRVALAKSTYWPGKAAARLAYNAASGCASSISLTCGAPASVTTASAVSEPSVAVMVRATSLVGSWNRATKPPLRGSR